MSDSLVQPQQHQKADISVSSDELQDSSSKSVLKTGKYVLS